jgi:hypothetical protein
MRPLQSKDANSDCAFGQLIMTQPIAVDGGYAERLPSLSCVRYQMVLPHFESGT